MVVTPNLVTGQVVKQAETDIIMAAIRAWRQLILDLLLAQQPSIVPGGFALAAQTGTPIVVTYAAGVAILAGYDLAVPSGSFTLAAANATFHRYDLLTVAYSQTTGTDSAGQATTVDTATPTVVTGTPSGSPSLPALPAGSVQLGWVDVPPTVTSATQCVIHSVQGPLVPNNLQDLTNHILAAITSSTAVHGIKQGSGNGFDADTVDGVHAAGFDAAGTATTAVAAEAATRAAADTTQATNLTTHTGTSARTTTGVHGVIVDSGHVAAQTVGNQSYYDFTVTFSYTQPDTSYVLDPVWEVTTPFTVGSGGTTQVSGKTTTGCSVRVTQNSGAAQGIGLGWVLVR